MVFALSSGWALNVVLSRAVILLYTCRIIINFIVCPELYVYCVNYQLISLCMIYLFKLIVL
ncbi:hypothetical protein C1646_694714 [Rhizophagus diaphanus]|nr:hypothetical protein C1646_694714 [Rhizophagus diaphanus] [Rhizophagus sp. MUCL 43196]